MGLTLVSLSETMAKVVLMSAQPKVVLSTKRSVGRTSETDKFAVYIDCGPIVMVD